MEVAGLSAAHDTCHRGGTGGHDSVYGADGASSAVGAMSNPVL